MKTFILLLLTLISPGFALAQRSKLVVVLVVDQMRGDYLTRMEPLFTGGLKTLLKNGAHFPNARTTHAFNVTAVGHASLLSGALPHAHGIITNIWNDPVTYEKVYCTQDKATTLIGAPNAKPGGGRSPKNFMTSTVGDELKDAFGGKPKVISIALKDRAAILMGGRRADLALWLEYKFKESMDSPGKSSPDWVTSTWYRPDGQLPEWVQKWNATKYVDHKVPKSWTKLLPERAYAIATPVPAEFTADDHGLGKTFPHAINGDADAFSSTPWGNDYVLDTGLEAIRALKLGQGEFPDLLAMSLSSFDAAGHTFGPLSVEMVDMTARLDRSLASFFDRLGKAIPGGLANVELVFTADHGAQTNPGWLAQRRQAGRIYNDAEGLEKTNAWMREEFSFSKEEKPVKVFFQTQILLNHELLQKKGIDLDVAARKLARWLRTQDLVAEAHTLHDLSEGAVPKSPLSQKMTDSIFPGRSGDVAFMARPGYMFMPDGHVDGTEHESGASTHDSSIALVFWGKSFKPGRYYSDARMIDIAPTLTSVLGIAPPTASEGQALVEAMRSL